MGYRSDVCVTMKREVLAQMLQQMPDRMKELLQYADRFESCDDSVLINWNCIKWYDGDSFTSLLKTFGSENYYFIELGEDADHNVTLGSYWDNPWNIGISRSISIDDVGKDITLEAFS